MRLLRTELDGRPVYATSSDATPREIEILSAAPWAGGVPTGRRADVSPLAILCPVEPSKIVCVGRNYAAHARELGNDVPAEPLLFLKPPSALLAAGGSIAIPRASERVEHEAEIGVVLGRRLRNASKDEALAAIYGITCVNDVTARDLQRKDVQFTRAKSFDTFCPVGPWIETSLSLASLRVLGRVNGQVRQDGRAEQMAFSIGDLLSFISGVMTLEPGDLVATGTPEGVGPLAAGDVVEIEVEGVGVLRNGVVGP